MTDLATTVSTKKRNGAVAPPFVQEPPALRMVPVALIDASPSNPRKVFADLDELGADIARRGLVQPIQVRPKEERFELVFGERRWRAAKLAKVGTLLATVVELTDEQVLETQLVENAKRLDISASDEADAYRRLRDDHGRTVEQIATMVSKSTASVYARLKLCDLASEARQALDDGRISPSVALLIARIPVPALQAKALVELLDYDGGLSAREAADAIGRRFHLKLADAPFSTKDAALVAAAGSCVDCSKRTGNARHLYPEDEVKSGDICTDPDCFAVKKDAAWSKRIEAAKAKGIEVLSDAESKKLFPYGSDLGWGSARVDLKDRCREDPKGRTWGALLGDRAPEKALAQDATGKPHELVSHKKAVEVLAKAGHKWAKPEKPSALGNAVVQDRDREVRVAGVHLAVGQLVATAEKKVSGAVHLRALLACTLSGSYCGGHAEGWDALMLRRGLCTENELEGSGVDAGAKMAPTCAKATLAQLNGLLVELCFWSDDSGAHHRGELSKAQQDLLATYKIDWKSCLAKAKASAKAKVATCRECGCTDAKACKGGCSWVEPDLCSRCYVAHGDGGSAPKRAPAKRAKVAKKKGGRRG